MGRPNKYFTNIQPRLEEVKDLCLIMTDEEMASYFDVSASCWYDYKNKYSEFREALTIGRRRLVVELKDTLIKKARGFQYTETKEVKDRNGNVRIETYTKAALPDVKAISLLLANYDREFWRADPAEYELKKKNLELQEMKLEQEDW